MPAVPRPNASALYAEIPPELHARLRDRAQATRRSVTGELIVALEKHLATPPEYVAPTTPPPPRRPRGRPRKERPNMDK